MYEELFEAWRKEKENVEIQMLSKGFYVRLASYVQKIREETRMLDQKTAKGRLMQREFKNVKKMVKDIVRLRYSKALRKTMAGKGVSRDALTEEEGKIQGEIVPSIELCRTFLKDILRGRIPYIEKEETPRKILVRFLQEIPTIIGSDMKAYGPFKPEDIATLPSENARILIKQGVAVEVEAKL